MNMFTLILVRHGHIDGIYPERFRGRLDFQLTETGKDQARATGAYIRTKWPAAAVYCSPLSRCVETATMIGHFQNLPVEPLIELTDIDYGVWQGRLRDEIKAEEPDLFRAWLNQPQLTMIKDAETLQDVQARIARALHQIRNKRAGNTVIVVGHDSTNRVLLAMLLDLPLSRYWHIQQDPCAINVLQVGLDGCRVTHMNMTAHLDKP